jgi:release factor glutamine methyltransferase
VYTNQALKTLKLCLIENSDTPALDAQVLLAYILRRHRSWILAHPEFELDDKKQTTLQNVLSQLESGIPVPYILGKWEFFGLEFDINPHVLIPRPETELLVNTALRWLTIHSDRRWALDIGTGSGCIAISLARHIANLCIYASDISLPALQLARQNAYNHHLSSRVTFIQCNLLPPIKLKFDLICTNLPYIPTTTLIGLPIYGREPTSSLDGGEDGLLYIRRLLERAPDRLAYGGLLLCEIESTHKAPAVEIACEFFPHADIKVLPDLAGFDRLLTIQT